MARLATGCNGSPVVSRYFLANGQTNTGSGKLPPAMQSLKHLKNTVQVFFIEANTVVGYINPVVRSGSPRGFYP